MSTAFKIALAAAAAAASTLANAHALLVSSLPAKDQALDAPPTEIRLTFNEPVEPRYAHVQLVAADGKRLDADRAHADKSDPDTVAMSVPVLKSGTWRAAWTAVGSDGHKTRGSFSFTVK